MQDTYQITKVDHTEVLRVMRDDLSGTYVKFKGQRGRIEDLWIEKSCTFRELPAGIAIERWFTGKNEGKGFKVFVTARNTGTVELIDVRVVSASA